MSEPTKVQNPANAFWDAMLDATAEVRRCQSEGASSVDTALDQLRHVGCALADLADLDVVGVDRVRAEAAQRLTRAEDRLNWLRAEAVDTTEFVDRTLGDVANLLSHAPPE
jgi:hypothetical protein